MVGKFSRTHRLPKATQGFTYLGVLFAIALLGISLATASDIWVNVARRQKMAELQWAGQQIAQAITSYYEAAPSGQKAYPARLEDLLEDKRFPVIRRHLRALYPNPFTGRSDWQIVTDGSGRIRGISAAQNAGPENEILEFISK